MTTTPDKVQAKRPLGLKNDPKNKKMKKDLNQKEQEITIEIKSENQNDFEGANSCSHVNCSASSCSHVNFVASIHINFSLLLCRIENGL